VRGSRFNVPTPNLENGILNRAEGATLNFEPTGIDMPDVTSYFEVEASSPRRKTPERSPYGDIQDRRRHSLVDSGE
jgi:hypothetical protein